MEWLDLVYGRGDGSFCFHFTLHLFSYRLIFMLELKLYKSRGLWAIPSATEIWRLGLLCYGKSIAQDLLVDEGYRMSLSLQEDLLRTENQGVQTERDVCLLVRGSKLIAPAASLALVCDKRRRGWE